MDSLLLLLPPFPLCHCHLLAHAFAAFPFCSRPGRTAGRRRFRRDHVRWFVWPVRMALRCAGFASNPPSSTIPPQHPFPFPFYFFSPFSFHLCSSLATLLSPPSNIANPPSTSIPKFAKLPDSTLLDRLPPLSVYLPVRSGHIRVVLSCSSSPPYTAAILRR